MNRPFSCGFGARGPGGALLADDGVAAFKIIVPG
jgi:hypothetical protein